VLARDLIVTVFADLPSLRLFGWLSAFAMLAALAADLVTFLHARSVVNDGTNWNRDSSRAVIGLDYPGC
jgi:hypothetical protein